jgi:hypothetical protein
MGKDEHGIDKGGERTENEVEDKKDYGCKKEEESNRRKT